jgi:GTP cyclohydrolase II
MTTIRKIAEAKLPTIWGEFRILGFEGMVQGTPATGSPDGQERRKEESVVLTMGDLHTEPPLLRIHSQCLTGDVFHSLRCDCRQQLELALEKIGAEGRGLLIYEEQEGRGIGLMAKLQAYELQDAGRDTVEANLELGFAADCRGYHMPVEILKAMGVKRVKLLTNNPEKVAALESAGIEVTERVSADVDEHATHARYLRTKREKMGHLSNPKQ